jgi:hypothetical protein
MNENDLGSKNTSHRRTYLRRNRKRNLTTLYFPVITTTTTTLLTTNQTLLINSSSVAVDDLAAGLFYFIRKPIFLIILSLLVFLCLISIIFLIGLYKCSRRGSWKTRRQHRIDKKRLKDLPDFLDEHNDHKSENDILLERNGTLNSQRNISITTNGLLPNDNVSNTFSLDPMLEQKINRNNQPNALVLSPTADDTSIDTLRGSMISSPSQQISASQMPSTPTTATDSVLGNPDERAFEAEKDDDLHDLDLPRIQPRFIKSNNNSTSNILAHRTSGSSIEQSIRRQERRAEEEERELLHGSNSNLYEKEIIKRAEAQANALKQQSNSQVSLVSRTSEDSCY